MSIHITDIVAGAAVVIAATLLAPVYTDLLDTFAGSAGSLTELLVALFLPLLFLGIIVSIGVSARRGA